MEDAVTIGRLDGSTGEIDLDVEGPLPPGVHAKFAPNPVTHTTATLTLTADSNAPPTTGAGATVTITGTPRLPSAGALARSSTLIVGVQPPCAHVATRQQLIDALAAGSPCIFVENDAEIDLAQEPLRSSTDPPDYVVHIPDGVTLESGRSSTVEGGLLYMSRRLETQRIMLDLGANTRVSGLRLRGYTQSDTTDHQDPTDGIAIRCFDGVLIDNNEISGWPNAGVEVKDAPNDLATAGRIRITGNFIHNNVQCGAGYGVVVGGSGFALIDRNVFNFNRHDVADDGLPGTGYVAEMNFVLTSGPTCHGRYNQHFDMHGTSGGDTHMGGNAGYYVGIRNNTIRGDQSYGFLDRLNRPAFDLRGTPVDQAAFVENAVAHANEDSAVRVEGADRDELEQSGKLVVEGNMYDVNTATELAVGDFDGDGRADVFQATGTVWVYSPSGRREWQFLNSSFLRLDRLALGDFNGDGKTDVFIQEGDQWLVSYGGTTAWESLPAGSNIPMKYYRFGDFDGDGRTDIFRADGSRFYVSSGGTTAWNPLAFSHLTVADLRFGDFNGDGRTDVFSLADGQWSVSYGGATQWQRLNEALSSDLAALVFGDFDGDGRTDIARSNDGDWEISYGGATPWHPLNLSQPTFEGMLFGDFDGDKRTDVLQHGVLTNDLAVFSPLTRFNMSSGGVAALAMWSLQDML